MAAWNRSSERESNNSRWAEEEEGSGSESDENRIFISPEENGIKTVIETRRQNGVRIQTTRKIQVTKTVVRKKRSVKERRSWAKFGQLKGAPRGIEPKLTQYTKAPIPFDIRIRKRGDTQELAEEKSVQTKAQVCTHCGEPGHWFLKCAKRASNMRARVAESEAMESAGGAPSRMSSASSSANPNSYVPPSRRAGASRGEGVTDGTQRRDRDDAFTMRLNNLPEETSEQDLRDLCRQFGMTTRVYLARDRVTELSRGFAFVSYADRESAEAAIKALDRHPYGNLLLAASFAAERKPGFRK